MRSFRSIDLFIFGVCFLEFHESSEICSGDEYTVTDADGKVLNCQSCAICREGYGLMDPKCGSTVQSAVENSCERCPTGTFSTKNDSGPCIKCQVCDEHQIVLSYCNSTTDTNCDQSCNGSYYFARDVTQACHKCSYCCGDEKDEEQKDCVRQGLKESNQHCSHRVDKNCAPDLSTDISSLSSNGKKKLDLGKTLAIIFGSLGGVAVVGLVVCAAWKRRQSSHDQGQVTEQVVQQTPMIRVDANSLTSQGNGNVSQDAALVHSSTTGSTPQPAAAATLRINPGYASSNPGTPRVSPHGTPKSQTSDDSHASGEQIKLVQQPISQNQREGSRVEFTCECQVQGNSEVWYQWFKDDTELQQQNNASLILDSVKMHDFGCYRCCITHRGGHGEAVTSKPAVLEVSPCEGKRLKYLREVELGTRDEIAIRLEHKTPGLGGYRQLAANYRMKEYEVRSLENSRQPGQDVLEFLRGSNTDLTVYSFCKKLKEDNMKRFDIVKVLENHLSIEKESK